MLVVIYYELIMRKGIAIIIVSCLAMSGCVRTGQYVRPQGPPIYTEAVSIHNTEYLPLIRFCNYYDLNWNWDLVSQRIKIEKGNQVVALRPDSKAVLINGKEYSLVKPLEYIDGTAYIPVDSAAYLAENVFGVEEKYAPAVGRHRINTVVIDPGHGGKDPGAVSRYGTKEKNIVLDVSKRLKKYLEAKGLKVYLTRDRDVFISLYKRPAFAKKKKADLFVSIHANAAKKSWAKGFEVFYLSEATDDTARALAAAENASLKYEEVMVDDKGSYKDPTLCDLVLSENRTESKELAKDMARVTANKLGMKARGAKAARFAVLKGASMPAVLVEIGFLTNRSEESRLKQSSFRDRIANAIAQSILVYKNEYERTDGFSR